MADPWRRRPAPASSKARARNYHKAEFAPINNSESSDSDSHDDDDDENDETGAEFYKRLTSKSKQQRPSLPASPLTSSSGAKFTMKRSGIKYTPSRLQSESSTEESIPNAPPSGQRRGTNGSKVATTHGLTDDTETSPDGTSSDSSPAGVSNGEELVSDSQNRPHKTRQSPEKLPAKPLPGSAVSRHRYSSLTSSTRTSSRPGVEVDDSEPEREEARIAKKKSSSRKTIDDDDSSSSDSGVENIKLEPLTKPRPSKPVQQAPTKMSTTLDRGISTSTHDDHESSSSDSGIENIKQEASSVSSAHHRDSITVSTARHQQTTESTSEEESESESSDSEAAAIKKAAQAKSTPAKRVHTTASTTAEHQPTRNQHNQAATSKRTAKLASSAGKPSPATSSRQSQPRILENDSDVSSDEAPKRPAKKKRGREGSSIDGQEAGGKAPAVPSDSTPSTSSSEESTSDEESGRPTPPDGGKSKKTDAVEEDDSETSESSDEDEPTSASRQLLQESNSQAKPDSDVEMTDSSSQADGDDNAVAE